MRKVLLIVLMMLGMVLISACSSPENMDKPGSDGKNYWVIGKARIDQEWDHAPRNIYNDDGSFKNRGEVFNALFGMDPDRIIDKISYQLVKPGTKRLEVTENPHTVYIADYDLFLKLEAGEQIESIRLWLPFIDRSNEVWCWEFVCKSDYSIANLIQKPGAPQELSVDVVNGDMYWEPGPYIFDFTLSDSY